MLLCAHLLWLSAAGWCSWQRRYAVAVPEVRARVRPVRQADARGGGRLPLRQEPGHTGGTRVVQVLPQVEHIGARLVRRELVSLSRVLACASVCHCDHTFSYYLQLEGWCTMCCLH